MNKFQILLILVRVHFFMIYWQFFHWNFFQPFFVQFNECKGLYPIFGKEFARIGEEIEPVVQALDASKLNKTVQAMLESWQKINQTLTGSFLLDFDSETGRDLNCHSEIFNFSSLHFVKNFTCYQNVEKICMQTQKLSFEESSQEICNSKIYADCWQQANQSEHMGTVENVKVCTKKPELFCANLKSNSFSSCKKYPESICTTRYTTRLDIKGATHQWDFVFLLYVYRNYTDEVVKCNLHWVQNCQGLGKRACVIIPRKVISQKAVEKKVKSSYESNLILQHCIIENVTRMITVPETTCVQNEVTLCTTPLCPQIEIKETCEENQRQVPKNLQPRHCMIAFGILRTKRSDSILNPLAHACA